MGRFIASLLALAILLALAVGFFFGSGRYDIAASRPPDLLDRFGDWVKRRTVPVRAVDAAPPGAAEAGSHHEGLEHYAMHCLPCHGAPGVDGMEFLQKMQPQPPRIAGARVQHWSDPQLFWIVKNGIRMSGMPAFGASHSDEEIGQIVAFVRHMPRLTDAERDQLKSAAPGAAHKHGADEASETSGDHHHTAEEPHGE
jgi:mono/diheme cytochrome c family protein